VTITHQNLPTPDGTRRQTTQQYYDGTITRIIESKINYLHLPSLKGVFAQQPEEDRLDHLQRISQLDNEDFTALSTYKETK